MHLLRTLLPSLLILLSTLPSLAQEVINPGYFTVGDLVYNLEWLNDQPVAFLVGPTEGATIIDLDIPAEVQHPIPDLGTLTVVGIEYNAFAQDFTIETVKIPATLTVWRTGFWNCISLRSIEVAEDNPDFTSVDGVLYTKNKTMLVVYPSGAERTSFTVPESVDTIWAYAFAQCRALKTITLPEHLNEIGPYSFNWLYSSLDNLSISEGVATIPYGAFQGCAGAISLPSTVTVIEDHVFKYCATLKTLTIKATTPPTADDICGETTQIFDDCTLLVPAEALDAYRTTAPWSRFTNIQPIVTGEIIVDGLKYIVNEDILSEVTLIGKVEGTALDVLRIPATITYNGFTYSVTDVAPAAFSSDPDLARIEVDPANQTLCTTNEGALINMQQKTFVLYPPKSENDVFVIPSSVNVILPYAIPNAPNLKIVVLSDISEIKEGNFMNCPNLNSVILGSYKYIEAPTAESFNLDPDTQCTLYVRNNIDEYISAGATTPWAKFGEIKKMSEFYTFSADGFKYHILQYLNLEMNSEWLSPAVAGFADGVEISDVVIPSTVEHMGVTFPVKEIDTDAFKNDSTIESLTIPASLEEMSSGAFSGCTNLKNISVDPANKNFYEKDNILYYTYTDEDQTSTYLRLFPSGLKNTELVIPEGIEYLYPEAFSKGNALESITLPSTMHPSSGIYSQAGLSSCEHLKEINVADGNDYLTVIDNVVYNKDMSRLCCYPGGLTNTSFEIPESVVEVATIAFDACESLKTVTISKAPDVQYSGTLFGKNSKVTTLICKTTTPPGACVLAILNGATWDIPSPERYNSYTLYVPDEAVETYRQYPNYDWSKFETILPLSELKVDEPIVEPIDTASIRPLTIAEAIERNNSEEMVWVKGYITGSVTPEAAGNEHEPSAQALSTQEVNVTIADTNFETDRTKMIAVQLTIGSESADALNINDHPENIGKHIAIYGRLTDYLSGAGLKDVTHFILDYVAPENGIDEIRNAESSEMRIYDLQGRRLSKPARGLNIINGRKIMIH